MGKGLGGHIPIPHLKNSFSHPLHSAPNPTWCFPEGATNLEHPMGMVSSLGH